MLQVINETASSAVELADFQSLKSFVSSGVISFTDSSGSDHIVFYPSSFSVGTVPSAVHFSKGPADKDFNFVEFLTGLGNARDFKNQYDDKGNYLSTIIIDHGLEFEDKPWPYGYIYEISLSSHGAIETKQISNIAAFNHSMDLHDFNNDGVQDILVQTMGAYDAPEHAKFDDLHLWISQDDGSYTLANVDFNNLTGNTWSGGSVIIDDINGDGEDEIIQANYGAGDADWGAVRVFNIFPSEVESQFTVEEVQVLDRQGAFDYMGASGIESFDYDGDGDFDFLVSLEGRHPDMPSIPWSGQAIVLLENNSGRLQYSQDFLKEFDPIWNTADISMREANIIDVNLDGDPDILLQGVDPNKIGVDLADYIFINDAGVFRKSILAPGSYSLPEDGFIRSSSFNSDYSDDFKSQLIAFEFDSPRESISLQVIDLVDNWVDLSKENSWIGSALPDNIKTGDENDTIFAGAGGDTVDGGQGLDRLLLSGAKSHYTLEITSSSVNAFDRRADGQEVNELINIEILDFETGIISDFDLSKFGGTASLSEQDFEAFIELYIAYFNRAPDAVGLNFWGTAFANGMSLDEISAQFAPQPETVATYPDGTSNTEFATAVYNNVLGRDPDQSGLEFWEGVLDAGAVSRNQFILEILRGVEAGTSDRAYLDNKVDIGAYFAVHKGMSDVENATAVMLQYDGTENSIDQAVTAIDNYYDAALDPVNGEFILQVVGVLDNPFT